MTSWRSADDKYRLIDGHVFMRANEAGKAVWVCITLWPTHGEEILLKLLQEAVDETRTG